MLQKFDKIKLEVPKSDAAEKFECQFQKIYSDKSDFGIFQSKIPKIFCDFVFLPPNEQKNGEIHYYSFGNFSIMNLIFYYSELCKNVEILMSTYSISYKSLMACIAKRNKGIIKNIRFIVDNRVRSLSPKPFALMAQNFEYRCAAIHAKVACIWNENQRITIVTSQNATSNPKIERGIVFFGKETFDFDKNMLEKIYERGTT